MLVIRACERNEIVVDCSTRVDGSASEQMIPMGDVRGAEPSVEEAVACVDMEVEEAEAMVMVQVEAMMEKVRDTLKDRMQHSGRSRRKREIQDDDVECSGDSGCGGEGLEEIGSGDGEGLFKGSTSQSAELGVRSSPAERPRTLRRLKNVYDGPVVPHDSLGGRVPTSGGGGGGGGGGSSGGGGGGSGGGGGGDKGGSLSILSPFDEQEEWNKISEIMASFGTGLVRESVFVSELEKEFQNRLGLTHSESGAGSPMATTSLGHWLASLGLLEFESVFRAHGYDDLDFINGVLEEGDLRDMGVSSEKDRSVILEAARSLPLTVREATAAAEAVEAATAQAQAQAQALAAAAAEGTTNGEGNDDGEEGDTITEAKEAAAAAEAAAEAATRAAEEGAAVDAWLRALRLECYCETFRKHLYTDMARVRRIWEVELTAVLEIGRVGHRRRILSSVGSAGGAPPLSSTGYSSYHRGSGPDLDDLTHDLNQLKNNIQQLKEEIREKLPAPPPASSLPGGPGSTGTLRHSHKKSRPAPPPPTAPPPGTGESPPQATTFPTNGELEIRGPSELLEGVPATLTTRWRHPPHALVTGCVNYVASYLGSTVVKELRGTESTKKSIQKLKKIPRDAATTPDIVLAISYRGVKFLNTLTQVLVCEHEIRNIHCACQDADDLTHFAYITKDHASRSHYCHVFCVHTMDQATEIILTLGQAFEVAYQLALRDQFSSSGGGGGGRGRNGNGHARSQSAAAPAPGLSAAAPSPGGGCGGLAPPASGHARSHSVNEMKLNGLAARETRIGGGGTATSGTTGSPAKASPGANGAAGNAAPLVLKEEL